MGNWEIIKGWLGGWFGVFVYAAIVCLFLIGLWRCILPVARSRELLKRAIKYIRQGDKAKKSWQEAKFLGKGALMPHWTEYLNNLFFADGEYHNPSNVEDYINEDTVIEGPGRSNLAEAIPGVLVSLGFLGTLMGLSVALSNLNTGAGGAEGVADVLSVSMRTLLDSMKYAFLTSIFGVIGSVTFTLLTRVVHGRAERALNDFYNAMSRFAGVVSVDPMTQIAIYQQEQTVLLKQLADAVGENSLRTSFRNAIMEAMNPFRESLDNFVDVTGEKQAQLMEGVADAYLAKMDGMVHGQFDRLAQTIQDTCRYQEKTARNVTESLNGFAEAVGAMREIRNHVEALFGSCDAMLSHMKQAQARMEETVSRTEGASRSQAALMGELMSALQDTQANAGALVSAVNTFVENADAASAANADALGAAVDGMNNSAAALTGALTDAREKLTRDMDESLNYFESMMSDVLKRVEWAAEATRGAVDGLPSAVADASGAYIQEIQTLTSAVKASREQLDQAMGVKR